MFKVGQHWCHNSRRVMRIDSVRISHNPNYADIQGVCAHGSKYSAARTNPERHALFGWVLLNSPEVDEVWEDRANPHNLYHVTGDLKLKCFSNGATGHIKGSMLEFHARCKYVGVTPKVGDTWGIAGASVSVSHVDGRLVQIASTYSLDISDFLNKAVFICRAKLTNLVLATGDKEPLNASTIDRRFTVNVDVSKLIEGFDKLREYCNKDVAATQTVSLLVQRNTIWRSRKGRYVTLVGVTPKVVHLRDAITGGYVGFRSHADFLRTYERVLTKGESWSYKAQAPGVVEGTNGGCVSFFDRWVGRVEHFELKDFLANAKPTPPVTLLTPQIGRGLRGASATHVVLDHAQPQFTEVGSFWMHKKSHRTVEVVKAYPNYITLKWGDKRFAANHSYFKEKYDPVPKGRVAAVRAEADAAYTAGKMTLTTKYGKEFMLMGKGSIIEFCRAVLEEADKCQPST